MGIASKKDIIIDQASPFWLMVKSTEEVAKIVGMLPSRGAEALAHHNDLAEFDGVEIPKALEGGRIEAPLRWEVTDIEEACRRRVRHLQADASPF